VPTCEDLLRRIEREAEAVIDGMVGLKVKASDVRAKL
jgi:hypothetical protein